jgi:hypothetical protein
VAVLTPLDGGRIKKGRASLVGGIAVGVAVLALWSVIALDLQAASEPVMFMGGAVAALVGLWIWKADL